MRKTIAAATIGASLAVGGLAGSVLGPGLADAQDSEGTEDDAGDGAAGWVQDALGPLVDEGTITQEQADAVEDALADARPDGGFGHRAFVGPMGLSSVAEALGVSEDDLRAALEDGRTIAEVAEEEGVDVQEVVDAVVAAQQERLDEAVADGDLTQEEADEFLADAEERATDFVNGELPDVPRGPHGPGGPGGDFGPGHGFGPWGDHAPGGDSEDGGDNGDEAPDEGTPDDTTDTTT